MQGHDGHGKTTHQKVQIESTLGLVAAKRLYDRLNTMI
jgi:hypothetical protein